MLKFRRLQTATGRNTGNASSSNLFALALGSVAIGLGGYYVGVRRAIETPPPKPVYGTPEDFAHAIEELKTLFSKDTVTTDKDQLEAHGFSPNAYHPGTPCHSNTNKWFADIDLPWTGCPHSVVVYPESTEDVVRVVNVARKYRMPIIPYSGGTSLEGHFAGVRNHLTYTLPRGYFLNVLFVLPLQWKSGGICVDMSGMDKIIAIHGMCFSLQSAI